MLVSERFLDINQILHTFPDELKDIGFSTTLLHNHAHAPSSSALVYFDNFTRSEYFSSDKIEQFYPCSWYLKGDKIEPYEFCDEKLPFIENKIEEHLKLLESKGFQHYGVTERPIKGMMEL